MHRAAADHQFELKVAAAIKALRRVLTAEKQRPVLASIAPHDFVDKYALAEQAPSLSAFKYLSSASKSAHSHPPSPQLTATVAASALGVLAALGLERAALQSLAAQVSAFALAQPTACSAQTSLPWDAQVASDAFVTLRCKSDTTCTYVRKEEHDVDSATKVVESSTLLGRRETKLITTVTEFYWAVARSHEVLIFTGASDEPESRLLLSKRVATATIVTRSDERPHGGGSQIDDCDITWLLRILRPPRSGFLIQLEEVPSEDEAHRDMPET